MHRLYKRLSLLIIFLLLSNLAFARSLTTQEIQRLGAAKQLLYGVDTESLPQTIAEIEKMRHPAIGVQMKEAVAHAYTDILKQENIVLNQQRKQWLYSMVCLNMAYFQFDGKNALRERTTDLNKLIRRELAEYLPANIYQQPGFFYSLS